MISNKTFILKWNSNCFNITFQTSKTKITWE